MTVDTRLAMVSGSKSFTALVVLSLAADGTRPLTTRARELLGGDLPLIDDQVTVEHLLTTAPASATTSTRATPTLPRRMLGSD